MLAKSSTRQRGWRLAVKMLFDKTVAALLLLMLSPLLLAVALLVRLKLGSPVFFWQTRPGYQGRPFQIIKFRTMIPATSPEKELATDAQRMSALGSFMRSASMDELPELWNVLRGELSLVGPRPLLMQYLDRYTPEQARRHDVLPGITGLAQINGRNDMSWEKKFELDVWYVDNWSFWLDMKILFKTIFAVSGRKGIALSGHATTIEFQGTEILGSGKESSSK